MPAQETKRRGRGTLAAAVLALLSLLSAANIEIVNVPLSKLIGRKIGFEDFVDEVQKGYLSDSFAYKNDFVDLNGLFARLTGRRTLNTVVKLNNGMLSKPLNEMDLTALGNGIVELSDYLKGQDIPFLYVQLSYKEALDGQSFPVGVSSRRNTSVDGLLSRLSAAGVDTLDLRPLLSRTPEMLERYFYKTDHHWNSDGAFVAYQEIMAFLHETFPEGNIDLTYAQTEQWERHQLDDWFLGSWGKRVGTLFAGTDPLIWHTPKFETEMSCVIPTHGWFYRGDFAEANLREQYIEEKNYFGRSAYCVYIGGDYPLVQHRNLNAPSPLKVLMLKDSFTSPLQAYLSTVFQEIDVIDPRFFSECSVAEYVEWTKPDAVILALNPDQMENTSYRDFGVEEAVLLKVDENRCEAVLQQDVELEAKDSSYNYAAYPLEADTVYRVAFEGVDVPEGRTEGAALRLYDSTTGTVLKSAIFDLAYCEAANSFCWTFRTPDTQDELQLLFYAGIFGATAGNRVIYREVTVEKLRG